MNISCRIANADTQCGRITNPPERVISESEVESYQMQYSYDRSFPRVVSRLKDINVHSVGNIRDEDGQLLYPAIYKYSNYIKKGKHHINMKYIILLFILFFSQTIHSQSSYQEECYISDDLERIIIKNDTLYLVANQPHLRLFWNDTIAVCKVERLTESLLRVSSFYTTDDMKKDVIVDFNYKPNKSDSIQIEFDMPYDLDNLDIAVYGEGIKECKRKSNNTFIISREERFFNFSITPIGYIPHSVEGSFYGLLYFTSSAIDLNEEIDSVHITIPFINNAFFQRYYIKEDYIYVEGDLCHWKGKVYHKVV